MKNLTPELKKELFPENAVMVAYRGSIVHNMYIPNTDPNSIDDIDLMGVYLAPKEYYIGLGMGKRHDKGQDKFVGQYDTVNYELRKFVSLLLKSNPNVLGMLWVRENHYLYMSDAGQALIDNREAFVSKLAYKAFTGYAFGQLKKMTHFVHEGYMGEKRKALVEKYGYDCKNAAHCIRLLRMGMEYLTTGELNVHREDASQLLDIKKGAWTLDQVKSEATRLFKLTDEAYVRSTLPNKPDYDKVEKLVMDILYYYITKEETNK